MLKSMQSIQLLFRKAIGPASALPILQLPIVNYGTV